MFEAVQVQLEVILKNFLFTIYTIALISGLFGLFFSLGEVLNNLGIRGGCWRGTEKGGRK